MTQLRVVLYSEGSSDRVLLPIIEWIGGQMTPPVAVEAARADLGRIPRLPATTAAKWRLAVEIQPCEILCVHRDANGAGTDARLAELATITAEANLVQPVVPIIPVHETEAWLLLDEPAIRAAAGNPHGRIPLAIPPMFRIESIADPKAMLTDALLNASELSGRRRRDFRASAAAARIPSYLTSFHHLRSLSAFRRFEDELTSVLSVARVLSPL